MARRVLAAMTILGIAILLFAPAKGAVSISATTQAFADRLLYGRFNDAEVAELAQLDCIASAISGIPDGADVFVHPIADGYLQQRLIEIAFPRIRPVSTDAPYEVYVDTRPSAADHVQARSECADATIWVVSDE